MIATIAHDIRTPLNQIKGMISLIKKGSKGKTLEYVKVCEEAVSLMMNLANDTIDLYKIQKGEFDIRLSKFKLDDVIKSLQNLFKYSLEEKKILWETEIDHSLNETEYIGDKSRIK